MAYLAAQGVLQAAGVTLDRAAGEEALTGLRVEEAHVAGLLAALQAALADPEEVEAAQDAVDIRVSASKLPDSDILSFLCSSAAGWGADIPKLVSGDKHNFLSPDTMKGDDFAEVVSGCGHALIVHKGQQRVLKIALEMFIKTVSSTEEPAGVCGTDELARRLEV